MIDIYLAITQKQLINFESLISTSEAMDKSNSHKILIRDTSFSYKKEIWNEVITSEVIFQSKSNYKLANLFYMFKKIKTYKKIINQLEEYKNSKNTRIFICYIEDVLSNFLFFNFNNTAEFVVVEDGVLNYYNHTLKNVNSLRFAFKKIISRLYGIPFKAYKGHSSGIEYEKVSKQFLTFPDAAFVSKQAHQLPVIQKTIDTVNQGLFIIGQETYLEHLPSHVYKEKFKSFLTAIFLELPSKSISHVVYKPRYKINVFEKETLDFTFGKANVTIIDTKLSSEEYYFKQLKLSHIASFDSSTSINIYAQLLDEQKTDITFFYYPIFESELHRLFNNLGFKCLN